MTKGELTAVDGSTDSKLNLTDWLNDHRLVTCFECDGTGYVKRTVVAADEQGRQTRKFDCHCLSCDCYFEWTAERATAGRADDE